MQAWLCIYILAYWMDGPSYPYLEAGLSREEAVVHLLNRMTFGPGPDDSVRVMEMGLEAWFRQQLTGALPDEDLEIKLKRYPVMNMSGEKLLHIYPTRNRLRKMAMEDGVLTSDVDGEQDAAARIAILKKYAAQTGARPPREIIEQMKGQKLTRAVLSQNQVQEVMTDFWLNHFTVSWVNKRARHFIPSYERDAIRPNALGNFRQILDAVAKHPAMLLYLDNAGSTADPQEITTMEMAMKDLGIPDRRSSRKMKRIKNQRGINENYARELLELHTLGVDGGYRQQDVVETARAFTGWTVWPMGDQADKLLQRLKRGRAVGFERQNNFLFRADAHDAGPKKILGVRFPKGGGLEEGDKVLDLLANHPSTARFIALKLARRFVADNPSEKLVHAMAAAFRNSGGDIKTVLNTMLQSKEFWLQASEPNKIKTPLELAASSVRALDAQLFGTRKLADWVEKMGQPLYASPAPNGFSDLGANWLNAATLILRNDFLEKLASRRVPGVQLSQKYSGTMDIETARLWMRTVFCPSGYTHSETMIHQLPNLNITAVLTSPGFQQK